MGFLATSLASVPSSGFKWYIFILTDNWSSNLRDEIEKNFEQFASVTGEHILVVKGIQPESFYSEIFNQVLVHYQFEKSEYALPALLVTNKPLPEVAKIFDEIDWKVEHDPTMNIEQTYNDLHVAVFSLHQEYFKRGSVVEFLKKLAVSLHNNDISQLSNTTNWQWLTQYFELKPNFFGFGVNFNTILEDLFAQRKGRRSAL